MHHSLFKRLFYRWLRPGPLRQLQAGRHAIPDFLVIGAMRSGTTSLHQNLVRHPQIHPAIKKEVHYFDLNYGRGLRWYRAHFPRTSELRASTQRTITGETSPYYLFHPLAAARAAKVVPQARLVVILRDPVERAYSHYWHGIQNGYEQLGFAEAIAAESQRLDRQHQLLQDGKVSRPHQLYSYLARGQYFEQIQSWLAHFSRDQMLILDHESYFDPEFARTKTLCEFLGIDSVHKWAERRYNQTQYPPLDDHLRAELIAHFEPYNEALFNFLGRSLPWTTD